VQSFTVTQPASSKPREGMYQVLKRVRGWLRMGGPESPYSRGGRGGRGGAAKTI
jgi:hypothetical protein